MRLDSAVEYLRRHMAVELGTLGVAGCRLLQSVRSRGPLRRDRGPRNGSPMSFILLL